MQEGDGIVRLPGTKFLYELQEGELWTIFDDQLIILHPDRSPKIVNEDGTTTEIMPMPKHPGPPLRKVTLNLFEADCEAMETRYGYGWSEKVRDLVHDHLRKTKTLGDFDERD